MGQKTLSRFHSTEDQSFVRAHRGEGEEEG